MNKDPRCDSIGHVWWVSKALVGAELGYDFLLFIH